MHVVVDGGEDWGAAVTIPQSKVRVSFAIPWEGMLLLGTTDTLHEGEPEDAEVTDEDVRTILDEAASAIDGIGAVRASFLGLRVLPGGPGATANARRETVYTRGPTGMLSVAGGKLTTYRRIALDALEQLGVRNLDRAAAAAAGRDRPREHRVAGRARRADAQPPAPPLRLARGRGRRAGARRRVAPRAARTRTPRSARAGSVGAEHEFALRDEDVLRRRTTGWLAGDRVGSEHGSRG